MPLHCLEQFGLCSPGWQVKERIKPVYFKVIAVCLARWRTRTVVPDKAERIFPLNTCYRKGNHRSFGSRQAIAQPVRCSR